MSVANSYAKALYQTVAQTATADDLNHIENQFKQILGLLEQSKEVKAALFSPLTNIREKTSLADSIGTKMEFHPGFSRFLSLLAKKGRMSLLPQIHQAFVSVRLAQEGGISGNLVSAEPLSDADVETLAKAFSQKLGKKVAFQVSTDSSLLAGIKVTVNGTTFDGTLRSQLQKLRDRFVTGFTGNA